MKATKNIIMGIAAVMAVSMLGISAVSAQENVPQQADKIKESKAVTDACAIEIGIESDKYIVINAGSEKVDANNAVTLVGEADNKDKPEPALEKDAEIDEANASEAVTIEIGNESDKYTVISAGSGTVFADGIITLSEEDKATK